MQNLIEIAVARPIRTCVSENRYQSLVESARVGVLILDAASGLVTEANQCLLTLLDYTRDQVIGQPLGQIGLFQSVRTANDLFEKVALHGHVHYADIPLRTRSGSCLRAEVVSDLYVEEGQRIIQCVVRDLTEMERNAAALRASEERYRALADAAPDDVFIVDRDFRISYVNENGARKFGMSADSLIGKSQSELFPLEGEARNEETFAIVFETGKPSYLELELLFPGRSAWLSIWFVPLMNELGHVQEVMGVARDISALKESEAAMLGAQRFAQATVDALPDNIAVLDEHGIIIAVNVAWRNFAEANGFTGQNNGVGDNYLAISEADTGGDGQAVAAGIRAILAGERDSYRFEYPCHSTVEERWFQVNATRFTGNGPIYLVLTHEDITARKRAEVRLLASEERSATAQHMAHLGNWELDLVSETDLTRSNFRLSDEVFRIYGYGPGDIAASYANFLQAIHPDDRATVSATMFRSVDERTGYCFDHRICLPNGEERIVHQQGEIVSDSTGLATKIVGTVQDITERKRAEQALTARTRDIVTAWESMADAYFSIDKDWRFTFINSHGALLLQKTREELIGMGIWDAFPEAVGTTLSYLEYQRAFRDQVSVSFEEFYTPLGKWLEVRAYPSAVGLSVYFRDISERKLAEKELQFQKTLLEAQTETTLDGILVISETGKILSYNQRFLRMWDISADAVADGDDAVLLRTVLDRVVNPEQFLERVTYLYDHREERSQDELALRSGRTFDRYSAPIDSPDGTYYGRVWYFRDITKRREAEIALRESEARSNAVIQNALDSIITIDHEGRVLEFNPAAEKTFGYSREEALGKNVNQLIVPPEFHHRHTVGIEHYLKTGEGPVLNRRIELPACRKDGTEITVELAATAISYFDPPLFTAYVRDITEKKRAEALLWESQQRLALATESAHIGIWDWDTVSDKLVWDAQMFAFYGIAHDEFGGENANWENGLHPEDRESVLANVTDCLENGSDFRAQFRVVWPNGVIRHVESHAVVQQDTNGKSVRMIGVNWDITEHKESEAALRNLRDQLEVRVEKRTAELECTNAALQVQIAEREGAESETRKRVRQQAAVAEFGREALTDVDLETLLQGATKIITKTLNVEVSTLVELLPDGETLHIRAGTGWKPGVTGHRISLKDSSQAGFILSSNTPTIVTDLPEETRFDPSSLLLEHKIVSGVTVVVGGEGHRFGFLDAYTIRKRLYTQDDVHFLQAMANVLAAALEQRRIESEIRELNAQLKRSNEQLKVENVDRQEALSDLRAVTVVLEQAKDEAEIAREAAEVANRAKSEFLSRMSHELRTPLNSIIGFGQILAMTGTHLDAQVRDNIQQILSAGRHLLALINEVLDIARIEAGHLSLSPEPVALDRLVREALDMVRPQARTRGISLFNNIRHEHAELHVLADQQRLKQVLLNLLSNAVKYNRIGGTVTLSCETIDDERVTYGGIDCEGRLRLRIHDTGPGLTAEDIGRLFVPFERLGVPNNQVEGSGIGLALCKQLTEAMNGRIGVESQIGQGCTFWLELPTLRDREIYGLSSLNELADARTVTEGPRTPTDNPRTVLYIEDNLANIRLIERVLEGFGPGVQILSAMQGSLGLELAAQHLPDLILLDVNLPDIMGETVLARLKANPLTANIPVVVLSADATNRQIDRMMAAGALRYLTKPLDIEHFIRLLEKTLAASNPEMN